MKTIAEIIGGVQALLDINFALSDIFEESLTVGQKTFLQMMRVIEGVMPPLERSTARTVRRIR